MDTLIILYPWIKAFHLMAVISWLAGLFYLPRLFVHHVERAGLQGEMHETFCMMEQKLLRVIMRPAMIATWIFGLCMAFTPGLIDWGSVWPWVKAVCVILLTGFHEFLSGQVRKLEAGSGVLSGRSYRILNEVPTVLMIVIVISAVVKY